MPEVIEVRKYADFLNKKMKNKYIRNINILNGRYKKHAPFAMYDEISKALPLKVLNVANKGKFLYILLSNNFIILSTLGLSGGWVFKNKTFHFPLLVDYLRNYDISQYKKNALRHLNVEFQLDHGSIYYFDVLSFGTMKVITSKENLEKKLNSISTNIMDISFYDFQKQIMQTKNQLKPIGNVLMNQKVISGIGNYLRADILWLSHISPFRTISTITLRDLKKIYENAILLTWGEYDKDIALKKHLIKENSKLPIDYGRTFFIYRQTHDIYGNPVIKELLYEGSQKRFIYWVKKIQK